MQGRIVDVTTSDGIKLHGFLALPKHATESLWIIVHGVNGNFYGSTLLRSCASWLSETGAATLLVNTRGHDIASFNSGDSPVRLGSQCETLANCCLDFDAWTRYAQSEGLGQICVLGHSLGAVKISYWTAALSGEKLVKRFIALSPPRLNTQLLLDDPKRGPVFREHLDESKRWCEEGRPDHVMKVRFPLPTWLTAATYLDKYGSGDKFDYLTMIDRIEVPTLWCFGDSEVAHGSVNFAAADANVRNAIERFTPESRSRHSVAVVANADHSYRLARAELRALLRNWLTV